MNLASHYKRQGVILAIKNYVIDNDSIALKIRIKIIFHNTVFKLRVNNPIKIVALVKIKFP